jgi:hypothetical protein
VQQETGDHRAAAASQQQALKLSRNLGDLNCQRGALQELSALQRLTGDYQAAAATLAEAQAVTRDVGDRRPWRRCVTSANRPPRAWPATNSAWPSKKPATTPPPPPATSKP